MNTFIEEIIYRTFGQTPFSIYKPPIPESSILFLERVDVIGGETWIVFHPEVEDLDVQFRPVEEVFLEPMEW